MTQNHLHILLKAEQLLCIPTFLQSYPHLVSETNPIILEGA